MGINKTEVGYLDILSEADISKSLSIANAVPDLAKLDLTLAHIVKTLPPECFSKNSQKAWTAAIINVLLVVLGYCALAITPWFLLPFSWIFTGTALTGFFVLGHDCGHYSFAKRRWVNELAGHLFLLPLLYPFHNWRIQHNCHHLWTNNLGGEGFQQLEDLTNRKADIAWFPFREEVYTELLPPLERWVYWLSRGPLWCLASLPNWWYESTLNSAKFPAKEQSNVRLSFAMVIAFAAILFPILIFTTGIWGFIKFWLAPWLVFHFWLSTFTRVHHTSPEIGWTTGDDWHAVQAQLGGTVHCNYPRWVEFLCHDINVHIPHHISTAIPFYNLRRAHQSLQENWKPYLKECNFSWSLFKQMANQFDLYDYAEGKYKSFQEIEQKS